MKRPKIYLTLNQIENILEAPFGDVFMPCHYFDGTLTYTDIDGNVVELPDLGFEDEELAEYWLNYYGDRRLAIPVDITPFSTEAQKAIATAAAVEKLRKRAALFFDANLYKYMNLVRSLDYVYDPINDYDMTELKGEASKITKHKNNSTIKGTLITDVDAPEKKVSNYSTTYDDAASGRLASYATDEYNTVNHRMDTVAQVPVIRTAQSVGSAGDGAESSEEYDGNVSLTFDSITTPDAHSANVSKTRKFGYTGARTPQELIDAERQIAKFNVIKMFFEDFNHETLIHTWD